MKQVKNLRLTNFEQQQTSSFVFGNSDVRAGHYLKGIVKSKYVRIEIC